MDSGGTTIIAANTAIECSADAYSNFTSALKSLLHAAAAKSIEFPCSWPGRTFRGYGTAAWPGRDSCDRPSSGTRPAHC